MTAPVSPAETARKALTLFRQYLPKIFFLALFIYVPVSFLQMMLPEVDLSGMTEANISSYYGKLMMSLLSAVILALITGLFDIAVIFMTREADKPVAPTFAEAFDYAIRRFPKYLATRAMGFAVCFLLAMFCFLPGLIALLLFSLGPYILVCREIWGRRALKESSVLVKKNILFVLLVVLIQNGVVYLLSFAVSLFSGLLATLGANTVLISAVDIVFQVLISTAVSIVTVFMTLSVQEMIRNSPELDKVPAPVP